MNQVPEYKEPNAVYLPVAGPMTFVRCHACHGIGYHWQRYTLPYSLSIPCPHCAAKAGEPQYHAHYYITNNKIECL